MPGCRKILMTTALTGYGARVIRRHVFVLLGSLIAAPVGAADDLGVELVKSTPAPVAKGQRGPVSLTLPPPAGKRLLGNGPLLVHVSGQGVAVERALYRREDAIDSRAEAPRFALAFRAALPCPPQLR